MPPPKFQPGPIPLIQGFAAPQFDPRFHTAGKNREHTVLGLMLELWYRAKTHPEESDAKRLTFLIVLGNQLEAECPEVIEELTRTLS